MKSSDRIERCKELSKKTLVAIENPYQSVNYVFKNCIDKVNEVNIDKIRYIGIKDVEQIPKDIEIKLETIDYVLHTLDASSLGGRAIDVKLINPITARPMTGSSSGTAINVFLGINDLGIGTDGGGSVLAPSMALNLIGLICPLIEKNNMIKCRRKSTDGIEFYPSIGLISKDILIIENALGCLLKKTFSVVDTNMILSSKRANQNAEAIEFPSSSSTRREMIDFLNQHIKNYDFLIDIEGPIDTNGFGDTVYGHFDDETKRIQSLSNKCLSKVANMVDATSIVIPTGELSTSYILMCESSIEKIEKMLSFARNINYKQDELVSNYFSNLNKYIKRGYF